MPDFLEGTDPGHRLIALCLLLMSRPSNWVRGRRERNRGLWRERDWLYTRVYNSGCT